MRNCLRRRAARILRYHRRSKHSHAAAECVCLPERRERREKTGAQRHERDAEVHADRYQCARVECAKRAWSTIGPLAPRAPRDDGVGEERGDAVCAVCAEASPPVRDCDARLRRRRCRPTGRGAAAAYSTADESLSREPHPEGRSVWARRSGALGHNAATWLDIKILAAPRQCTLQCTLQQKSLGRRDNHSCTSMPLRDKRVYCPINSAPCNTYIRVTSMLASNTSAGALPVPARALRLA